MTTEELMAEVERLRGVLARIEALVWYQPDDDDDLVEAVRVMACERDEARAEIHVAVERLLSQGVRAEVERLRRERDEDIADAWRAKVAKVEAERDEARDEHDKVVEERERAHQACNAYWHDLERIASLCERTADEYPLKAVERTVRERDEARAEVERLRAALAQSQRADE